MKKSKPRTWGWFVLFTSFGTLLCCALPILLVSLGMGAVVASMAANIPLLVVLSQYKIWMFSGTALLLLITAWFLYRPGRACPAEPELAVQCAKVRYWNVRLYWISALVWTIGFVTSYGLEFFY